MTKEARERLKDADWLREQYVDRRCSVNDIASELGCSFETARKALHRHGVPLRAAQHPRPEPVPMIGKRFGRLVVLASDERRGRKLTYKCRCDCGAMPIISGDKLRSGHTRSCGCLLEEARLRPRELPIQHGHARKDKRSPTYESWRGMKGRCRERGNASWKDYGGRGITVCDRWADSFENFLVDMGERPEGLTLDRIDPDGNYEPGNCRWATRKQQAANKRVKVP